MKVELANSILEDNQSTCVILKGDEIIYTSSFIGVKPLLVFMKESSGHKPSDLVLVDKVIGKAALLLAAKIGIPEIHTPITSHAALAAAKEHHISLHAMEVVPFIENRTKTGMCPIEMSVTDTSDLDEAFLNINETSKVLMAAKS
ncbi:MAG: DUF1893 domain-containing protein [Clostridiaceae bacterium]